MSGVFASRLLGRNILAVGLCLLAVLFAVEAKLAWYSPVSGPGSEIRSAKPYRADAPQVIDRGASSTDVTHSLIALALLATIEVASVIVLTGDREGNPRQACLIAFSATNLFFRPPPVR